MPFEPGTFFVVISGSCRTIKGKVKKTIFYRAAGDNEPGPSCTVAGLLCVCGGGGGGGVLGVERPLYF